VAVAGRGPEGGDATAIARADPSPTVSAASRAATPTRADTHWPPIRTTPAWALGRPRTVLVVRGLVSRVASDVRVRLETAHGNELAVSPLDPTGHGHGGIIPFEATFRIDRRPTGADPPLFVVVVDRSDRPVVAGRHAYASSLFLDLRSVGRIDGPKPTPASAAAPVGALARSRGNDGLVGGIAFGIPFAERSGSAPSDH
jgi:hypothetical protein